MKILYVAPFINIPPDNGAAIRAYNLIMALCAHHRVTLITFGRGQDDGLLAWCKECLDSLKLLPPIESHKSFDGLKGSLQRLVKSPSEAFRRIGHPISLALEKEYAAGSDHDMIIIDTLMAAQNVEVKKWSVPIVLSLYDVGSNYQWRQFKRLGFQAFKVVLFLDWLKTMTYEKRIIRRFKYIATVSALNTAAIRKISPTSRILSVPNGVDTHHFAQISSLDANAILFVANFEYSPNIEGLWYFYSNIWPAIRAKIDATFLVVGKRPPKEFLKRTHLDKTVRIEADVPDVRPFYSQARISVVPLLNGEGTRLKILESFSMGVPVVTTSVGCEGLDFDSSESCVVADTAGEFAHAVVQLYSNEDKLSALKQAGRLLVERQYDWQQIGQDYRRCLEEIAAENETPS